VNAVFLGLGSNIEPCRKSIETAISLLQKKFPCPIQISPIYQTEPFGGLDQSSYLNCCVCFSTDNQAHEVLSVILEIENQLGRKRNESKWSSRSIDIDILLFGNLTLNSPELTIPHYDLSSRDFFLVPLLDLKPDLINPSTKKPIREELAQISLSKRTKPLRLDG